MKHTTPTERLEERARQAGVVLVRPRGTTIEVFRDGHLLTACANVKEALEFVGQLYPVGFMLAGPKGPVPARTRRPA